MESNHPSLWTRFPLGRTVATRGALAELTPEDVSSALRRHASGDWGDLDEEDLAANERALLTGDRLVSVYSSASHVRFYIITESDRSVTTVLLPHEY
jgi:hypothetical protein